MFRKLSGAAFDCSFDSLLYAKERGQPVVHFFLFVGHLALAQVLLQLC